MPAKSKTSPRKLILSIAVIAVAAYFGVDVLNPGNSKPTSQPSQSQSVRQPEAALPTPTKQGSIAQSQQALVSLAKAQRSGQMVELSARVVKILDDDNDGARHQKFLLAIDADHSPVDSVLVAHNIDLAPRVPVEAGSIVRIFGQYEWNDRGGVLHWTHHDPGGFHAEGWIEFDGMLYD